MKYTMKGTLDILPMGTYVNDNPMAKITFYQRSDILFLRDHGYQRG